MNICLIDADSVIPNIPLMKLSTYHKALGDKVVLIRGNIPYYPNREKKYVHEVIGSDKTYASVIFVGNKEYVKGRNIIFGGTGVDLTTVLPDEIEKCEPDYSIYPDNNVSYGFISRGCIRNCSFCFVPRKEGMIRQVAQIDDIVRHKQVQFLDNNILALPNHKEILQELGTKRIKCKFNQGLDIRLVDKESSELLHRLVYVDDYTFAFDNIKLMKVIERQINLIEWRKDWDLKFLFYVHPDMPLSDTIRRINFLKERKCLAFMMRDISCWGDKYENFYTALTSYCNRPVIYKNMDFIDFMENEHPESKKAKSSLTFFSDDEIESCSEKLTVKKRKEIIQLYKTNQ